MEFQWVLIVVMATIGVDMIPKHEIRFPLAVSLTQYISIFCGLIVYTILVYVTFSPSEL